MTTSYAFQDAVDNLSSMGLGLNVLPRNKVSRLSPEKIQLPKVRGEV